MKKKLRAILIDDEPKLRKVLEMKLNEHCPQIEVMGQAGDVPEGLKCIHTHKPDLVFLDIAMPGESGFDLLDKFDSIDFDIIFVTGYNEYAIDALRVSAVDYLLKPVRTEDLVLAVRKAAERREQRAQLQQYQVLKHNLQHLGDQEAKIAIPGAQAYDFVAVKDIVRCEGWQKYTRIYLMDGSCIVSSYNLGYYRQMLKSYGFYDCHKSHMINRQLISRYLKEGSVVMADESVVPVSRRKKEEFIEEVVKNLG